MRKIPASILLTALALSALFAARAEAATQILGIVASNGMPTPLRCQDGSCRGVFSSFCLQEDRPAPHVYTAYALAPGSGGLTLLATRADGSRIRVPAEGVASIRSDIGFSSVTIAVPEARLQALGAVDAAIEVAPMTTALPVPVAGDPDPQTPEEIALASGRMRQLAETSFETPGDMRDVARIAMLVVNSLPADDPRTAPDRRAAWDKAMALAAGHGIDPAAAAVASRMFVDCGRAVDMRAEFDLSLCMQLHQTDIMSKVNRDFWDSTGGS